MKVKELIEMLQEYEPESDIAVYDGVNDFLNFSFSIENAYTKGGVEGVIRRFSFKENSQMFTRVLTIFQ